MSAIRKPSIPSTNGIPHEIARVIAPIKENIEIITGTLVGVKPIAQLGATATTAQIISKVNEIIVRLNAGGV